VIYKCNKNQQNANFLHQSFNVIIVSSTRFEHRSVHPQEDLNMQFLWMCTSCHPPDCLHGCMQEIP